MSIPKKNIMKKIIGDKIKSARNDYRDEYGKKISQAELGFRALGYKRGENKYNAPQQKVRKIEAGEIDITIDELLKIASFFKKPLSYFLNERREEIIHCDVNCDKEMIEICRKVKYIRDSKTDWWESLEKNIDSFKKGVDIDPDPQGCLSGTSKVQAGRTGSRKKAG